MHTIQQLLPSASINQSSKIHAYETQLNLSKPRTIEMVPQILDLKKILVPIDFSDMSKHAFQYALRFAEQFRCKIVLLHVVEPEAVIAGTSLAVDVFAQLRTT